MSFCFSFDIPLGLLLLLFWRVLCLFGIVQVGLPVGFPLGAFLLTGMLLVRLLKGVRRFVLCGLNMVLLLLCLVSRVVLEVTGLAGLVEALKESVKTEKLQHLFGMAFGDATCLEEREFESIQVLITLMPRQGGCIRVETNMRGWDWLRPFGACAGPRLQAVHEVRSGFFLRCTRM